MRHDGAMDRETRLQAELAEIDRAVREGSIDENAAEALRSGAMANYDQAGWTWWKLLGGFVGIVLVLLLVLVLVGLVV